MARGRKTLHPDHRQLAAYLDGALDPAAHAELRAHILTCASCKARLERLRDDARRIANVLGSSGATPDVRAAVRAQLRRPAFSTWLGHGIGLAGASVALLLFALLLAVRSGATLGRTPDRLFVVDRQTKQLIELDAGDGARLRSVTIGGQPSSMIYNSLLDRTYIMLSQSIVAVDTRTLGEIGRWDNPEPFRLNAGMALDEQRGWLYAARANGVVALDMTTLAEIPDFHAAGAPGPLALAPDGKALFTIDQVGDAVRRIELPSGVATNYPPDSADTGRTGFLALSSDGRAIYVLRSGATPTLRRIDAGSGRVSATLSLPAGPAPWDLLRLDEHHLAIPRGDGQKGGITIVETDSLKVAEIIDPDRDQHHLVAGPGGGVFSLNFSPDTGTRYEPSGQQQRMWDTNLGQPLKGQPWDGAFVPGGWRWPWER
jgi:hypothetical protein